MTSTRPYLIRAFYDWIVDNNRTPYIVVNATMDYVEVPREYVDNGQIVLNVSVSAVQGLVLGDKAIEFQARFGGKVCKVYVPVISVLAIYAKENGRGMVFAEEDTGDLQEDETQPSLTAVETPRNGKEDEEGKSGGNDGNGGGKGGKGKGRGHLTLVK